MQDSGGVGIEFDTPCTVYHVYQAPQYRAAVRAHAAHRTLAAPFTLHMYPAVSKPPCVHDNMSRDPPATSPDPEPRHAGCLRTRQLKPALFISLHLQLCSVLCWGLKFWCRWSGVSVLQLKLSIFDHE